MSPQPVDTAVDLTSAWSTQAAARRRLTTVALMLLVAASWLATHRYHGIWHDGILYAGQALFRLQPAHFAGDLFFAYGSQDDFTAFSAIYALTIEHFGLPKAAAVMLVIAHLAWVLCTAFLLRGFLRGRYFWLALVLIVVLPANYGSRAVLAYGEAFLTARSWAEPASLLAVGLSLRGQRIAATSCAVFAAAMHPLIAFPAVLFVFFFGFRGRLRWLLAGVGLLSLVLLSAARVAPFDNLTQVMDPVWLAIARGRSAYVFLDLWAVDEYRQPLFISLLLTTAGLLAGPRCRRLCWSALAVGLVGMGLALLAVVWPGVLLVQMQPWRVLWLVQILAIAAAVGLVQATWRGSRFCRLLLGALAACAFVLDGTGLVCGLPLSAVLVAARRFGLEPRLPLWLVGLIWAAVALIIGEKIIWAGALALTPFDFTEASFSTLSLADRLSMTFQQAAWFVFPALLLGICGLLHYRRRSLPWLVVLSVSAVLFFGSQWQPASHHRATEDYSQQAGHAELAELIQPHQLSYWSDDFSKLWFVLQRPSYVSEQQSAGSIFSRQKAIEAERRLARVARLNLPDLQMDRTPTSSEESLDVSSQFNALLHACHDPILDFVVLTRRVVGTAPTRTVRLSASGPEFHVYACAGLRSFPDPFPARP